MRATVHNRGPEPASIHVLPQAWFRNIWSWSAGTRETVVEGSGRTAWSSRSMRSSATISFASSARIACCSAITRPISLDCSAALRQAISKMRSTNLSFTARPKR